MATADRNPGESAEGGHDRELLALAAHLIRNSATAILASAQTLRQHGDTLPSEVADTLWTRLEGHARVIAEMCRPMVDDGVIAIDRLSELARRVREETESP